jgi:hypothetical protein
MVINSAAKTKRACEVFIGRTSSCMEHVEREFDRLLLLVGECDCGQRAAEAHGFDR